jgi:hypothetical protein
MTRFPTPLVAAVLALGAVGWGCAASAATVGAGAPFTIAPGEQVTLGPGSGLNLTVSSIAAAPGEAEGPPAPKGADTEHMMSVRLSYNAAPGTLVFTLWDDPANGARLKLENGLDHTVIYAAQITLRSDGRTIATTICSTPSGKPELESWVDDLASITITGVYYAPNDRQVCGYADRDELSSPPPTLPSN